MSISGLTVSSHGLYSSSCFVLKIGQFRLSWSLLARGRPRPDRLHSADRGRAGPQDPAGAVPLLRFGDPATSGGAQVMLLIDRMPAFPLHRRRTTQDVVVHGRPCDRRARRIAVLCEDGYPPAADLPITPAVVAIRPPKWRPAAALHRE